MKKSCITPVEHDILLVLSQGPVAASELVSATRLTVDIVCATLTRLRERSLVGSSERTIDSHTIGRIEVWLESERMEEIIELIGSFQTEAA